MFATIPEFLHQTTKGRGLSGSWLIQVTWKIAFNGGGGVVALLFR